MILVLAAALALPRPVQAFLDRRESCLHFAGEEAYDEDRARFLADRLGELRCDKLDAAARRLRRIYVKRRDVLEALAKSPDE